LDHQHHKEKEGESLNQHFSKCATPTANMLVEGRYTTSMVLEKQIKTTMRLPHTHLDGYHKKQRTTVLVRMWRNCDWEECKMVQPLGTQFFSSKKLK
jgi:hypothetical protein